MLLFHVGRVLFTHFLFLFSGILTDIQKHFDVNDSMAGLLQTVFIISYMIFAPLFGFLGDRYSRKWIMAMGVFLWSLTTLLGSFMEVGGVSEYDVILSPAGSI